MTGVAVAFPKSYGIQLLRRSFELFSRYITKQLVTYFLGMCTNMPVSYKGGDGRIKLQRHYIHCTSCFSYHWLSRDRRESPSFITIYDLHILSDRLTCPILQQLLVNLVFSCNSIVICRVRGNGSSSELQQEDGRGLCQYYLYLQVRENITRDYDIVARSKQLQQFLDLGLKLQVICTKIVCVVRALERWFPNLRLQLILRQNLLDMSVFPMYVRYSC